MVIEGSGVIMSNHINEAMKEAFNTESSPHQCIHTYVNSTPGPHLITHTYVYRSTKHLSERLWAFAEAHGCTYVCTYRREAIEIAIERSLRELMRFL